MTLASAVPCGAEYLQGRNESEEKSEIGGSEFQKTYLERLAVQPVPGALDAFAEYLRKDSAKWGEVIHAQDF